MTQNLKLREEVKSTICEWNKGFIRLDPDEQDSLSDAILALIEKDRKELIEENSKLKEEIDDLSKGRRF